MIQRLIDIIIAGTAIVVLSPLIAMIAALIRLFDGPPVIFSQHRAGLKGRPFRMFKFRTMQANAEATGTLTYSHDSRITSLGRFLRRHKLDELPQLLNVLRGEMALIGPRPEVLDWAEKYTKKQREVFTVKPGLSDPVQLEFRHEQDYLQTESEYAKLLGIKVQRQIECIRERTVFRDLVTAMHMVRALLPSSPSEKELAVYESIRKQSSL